MWLVLLAQAARADQCAWITEAQARAAIERLKPGAEWASLCEPCGEREAVVRKLKRATMAPVGGGQFEISIDGKPVDLAYTYVHTDGETGFTNLASLAQCPASGVTVRLGARADAPDDRREPWVGTFETDAARLVVTTHPGDPRQVLIQLQPLGAGSTDTPWFVLTSTLDVTGDPGTFDLPFEGCHVVAERGTGQSAGQAIELRPEPACGPVATAIRGLYVRT